MENDKNKKDKKPDTGGFKRRDVIKAMASLPILGLFGYEYLKINKTLSNEKASVNMFRELGLQEELSFNGVPSITSNSGDTIRLGIIGAGSRSEALLYHTGFAPKEKVEAMSMNKISEWMSYRDLNVALTGVCEVFDQRAELAMDSAKHSAGVMAGEENPHSVKRFRTYREMLDSDQIDAVIIATPDHLHAKIAIDAINAGKHVYCEKGPSHSEEESLRLYDTVKGSGLVYQLGHQIRHNPIYPYAADLVKKGVLGQVNLIEVTTNRNSSQGAWVRHLKDGKPKPGDPRSIDWDQWLGDNPKVPFSIDRYYNWTKYWDYGTGLFGQLLSHEYDAVNGIMDCGIPESCTCSGGIYYYQDGREVPDLVQVVFEYPQKKMTLIYSATLANSRNRGRIFMGRDASMEIGNSLSVTADGSSKKYQDRLNDGSINSREPMITVGPKPSGVDGMSGATTKYYEERGLTSVNIGGESKDVTHLHLREWIQSIRNGGETSCGIEKAFQEAITIQMAKKAYLERRQVRWDSVARKIV